MIEVKRVSIGKNPKQTRKVIGDANKQIKRGGKEVGSIFLFIERPHQRVAFDDAACGSRVTPAEKALLALPPFGKL